MLITIQSDNRNFSWAIGKNPNNPLPLGKSIRKGYGIGQFIDPQQYRVLFLDAPDEISYPYGMDDEFAYLHNAELVSPMVGLNIIGTFFGKIYSEHDTVANHKVTILALEVSDRTLRLFNNNAFNGFTVNAVDNWQWNGYKTVIVEAAERTLSQLFDFLNVFLLQTAFDNRVWLDRSEELAVKYINALINVGASYHMRYIFKINLLRKNEVFDNLIGVLNGTQYKFTKGNTQMARQDWTSGHFTAPSLIDLGCGEGNYFKYESKFTNYYAVDIDPVVLADAETYLRRKRPQSEIEFFANIADVPTNIGRCDILLSEVIEHVPLDELPALLRSLERFDYEKIIITTPNAAFNPYFNMADDTMRHDDHKWEMTTADLSHYLTSLGYDITVEPVGDMVGDVAVTTGIIIKKVIN